MEAQCDKCEEFIKMLHSAQADRLQLSNEIKRLKAESDQILNDAIANIDRKANKIAELTDTLAAVMASDWRDIGTLPKIDPDTCRSNDLLGCWPNGSMMVVYLDVCNGWMDSEGGESCVTMPTHWQPLPEPPSTESV